MATEMQRRNLQVQQQVREKDQQTKEQASVANSGNIVRALRSAERQRIRSEQRQRHQHDRQEKKQERTIDARDNRLALTQQREAVRLATLRQQEANLPPEDQVITAHAVDPQLNPGEASAEGAIGELTTARQGRGEPEDQKSREAEADGLSVTPGAELDPAPEISISTLVSTPARFGGDAARDRALRNQIEGFVEFLTSSFTKRQDALDPVEEAFSILRWAIMLEAIGELAQKFILESAAAAGFDAESIRQMVANAVRILESKDVADADFVAMLEEELEFALDSSNGPEFDDGGSGSDDSEEGDSEADEPLAV